MKEAYLVAGRRTPIGSFNGALASVPAPKLGAAALKAALEDTGLQPGQIEELFMGNVLSSNLGQAPATQVALYAGLPNTTPTTMVNKVCASGMKTIMFGAQAIRLGERDIVAAGGMENMSLAPHFVLNYRNGYKYGNAELLDAIVRDGLQDVYSGTMMGVCGDLCAKEYNISREEQDAFSVRSYELALAAAKEGKFKKSIVPVSVASGKGEVLVTEDEEPGRVKFDKIPTLRPAFQKDGTITAANASKINDGAAAVILASEAAVKANNLKPFARIVAYADASRAPEWFTLTNIDTINAVCKKSGIGLDKIDLFEINEAFAVVCLSNAKLLNIDVNKINVNGGAVAMGHPIGMSGTRIVYELALNLKERGGKYGIAAICNGGGGSSAVLVEAL